MLDKVDVKIINKLGKNGRISLTELSEGTGLSRVAIANRIDKLIKNNLLHVGVSINLSKLNYQTFIVELQVPEKRTAQFKKIINKSPKVLQSFEILGEHNWMLVCADKNSKRLKQFIDYTLKKFAESCKITIASVPHGPEFIHHKSSEICKACELEEKDGI